MKLILLFLFCSCSLKKPEIQNDFKNWDILENSISNNWTGENLKKILGEPDEKSKKDSVEIWYYLNSQGGHQEWSFGITNLGLVVFATYLPVTNDPEYSLDKIKNRWSSYTCQKKLLSSNIPHVVKSEEYLSCNNGKRNVYYNRYLQVLSLTIEK